MSLKITGKLPSGQHLERLKQSPHFKTKGFENLSVTPMMAEDASYWKMTKDFFKKNKDAAPARHFSGRGIKRAQTLWSSFVLQTATYRLFLGGDSGYDSHFKTIGEKYGPFDIALLEAGQYNKMWPLIHMMPEETVQAAADLQAKLLLPVHWGKFSLAMHAWNEPVKRVLARAKELNIPVRTPMIGEPTILGTTYTTNNWWES